MKRLVCGGVLLVVLSSLAFASAGSAEVRWKVIARASDGGDQVAVVAVAKRRVTKFAVRVRVTGEPKTAKLHAVVTCSKAGFGTFSRGQQFTLTGPAMRPLQLPVAYPENCGVTVIAIGNSVVRVVGDTVYTGRVTVEILAPCVVQTDGGCIA
jgi:hypothetical protein